MAWFNAAPPAVVDSWLAYHILEQEDADASSSELQDPANVGKLLSQRHG